MSVQNIIIGVVIVIVIYLLYVWFFGDSTRQHLLSMHDARKPLLITGDNVPHGSSVQDLLNNFNSHRRPSKQIHQVFSQNDEVANQQVIKKDSIFFVK